MELTNSGLLDNEFYSGVDAAELAQAGSALASAVAAKRNSANSIAKREQRKENKISCGKKPGAFASKKKKQDYERCVRAAASSKNAALTSQSNNNTPLDNNNSNESNNKGLFIGIGVALLAATAGLIIYLKNR
jgi:hypothetical protein